MKKKLFPILLVGTLVVGGAVAFAIWRATPESAQGYLASGKKYFDEKKYSEAGVQLLNAVQLEGSNRDARYLLAQTYLVQGDGNSAARQLMALIESHPDDVEANILMGNLYLAAGGQDPKNLREADGIAKKILAKKPDNIPALLLSGNVTAGMKEYPAAVEIFHKIIALDPKNVSAMISLGATQVLLKNLPEAEQAFVKAREADPKNRTAILSLANFYRTAKDNAKAEAVLNEGMTALPDDLAIYTAMVQMYYQTGRFEMGVALLKEKIAKDPKNPQPYFVLADMYKSKNMAQESRDTLVQAKTALPDSPEVAMALATNLLSSDPKRARLEVEQVLKVAPEHPMANLYLGELQFTAGEFDKAEATLSRDILARARLPEAPFFLGSLALRKGEVDKAIENFQKAVTLNPQYIVARVALGEVLMAKGNTAAARTEADNALNLARGFIPARLLKVSLDRADKNFAAVESELALLAKEAPNSPQVHLQAGLNHASRGRLADAEKSYLRVMELQPGSLDALRGLVDVYVRGKQTDKAIRTIQSVPADQKRAFHYELLGMVYAGAGKNAEADAAFREAIEKEPSRSSAEGLLARHYITTGRMAEGLAQLDELTRRLPAAAAAYAAKGQIHENQGDLPKAKNDYEAALKADPNYEPAANNLAYLLAEEGKDLDRALGFAQMARRKQPESAAIADTLGWVHHKMGNQVLAREQLMFATSKDPENPVLQYHLGLIYKANQQNLEAEGVLKKALASKIPFKEKPQAEAALKEAQQK